MPRPPRPGAKSRSSAGCPIRPARRSRRKQSARCNRTKSSSLHAFGGFKLISYVMTTRRNALAAALALVSEAAAHGQTQNGQAAQGPVFQHDLPNLTMDDWQVTVSEVPMPPGRVGQTHHHPGFVLAYVLEGAVVTKVSGQPERTYKTGEMF